MSTTTFAVPARQPFGETSQTRLRNLANLKNTQNGSYPLPDTSFKVFVTSSADSLQAVINGITSTHKPFAATKYSKANVENIEPSVNFVPTKGKVFGLNAHAKGNSPSFYLSTAKANKDATLPQLCGSKRKNDSESPSLEVATKRRGPDSSIDASTTVQRTQKYRGIGQSRLDKKAFAKGDKIRAKTSITAGRSYRNKTNAVTSINPPVSASPNILSLNEALAGTSKYQKNWDFKIYEDTSNDNYFNTLTHSTEKSFSISNSPSPEEFEVEENNNKENEPPCDYVAAGNAAVARRDKMSDEVRTPLGDLNTKEFYGDGCDQSSYVFIPEDEPQVTQHASLDNTLNGMLVANDTHDGSISGGRVGWEDLIAKLPSKKDIGAHDTLAPEDDDTKDPEFQIWESSSAKAENETVEETNGDGEERAVAEPFES
ncbi:uncharacterized protein KY384_005364 [Bacidia gigantensis]|uniref:uncharacterized protein n=1 Tax=Bacidia gigantensis TaxID=2732470 RepID=UPI001D03D9D9|nr:uncharacterized protein KY384_005364 [Bacidia gigantensis]KAG8529883.1 hypothetical protein KY384_005364 [Bacidia gigantensis]